MLEYEVIAMRIKYTLAVDTDEGDRRLALLHQNLMKYGIIRDVPK